MPQARRKTLEVARREEGALKLEGRLLLLVDDDRGVIELLRRGLAPFGYRFVEAEDGTQALTAIRKHQPDLILMDVEMPGLGGVEVCRIVKANQGAGFAFTPVILMTAGRSSGKVEGLELGADDYLVKPFAFSELLARVRTLMRRGRGALESNVLRVADLELDLLRRRVSRAGGKIDLTAKEFALLELFMRRAGEVLPRSLIASQVWDMNFDSDTNVIDVAVRRLRAKVDDGFEPRLIHTVRGMGYVLEATAP